MPRRHAQQGAVLFVSLVILLVLSLFAIITANTSIMQNKMVGSGRNMQLANLAADSALNEAKVRIAQAAAAYGAGQVCAHLVCAVRDANMSVSAETFMQTPAAQAASIAFRVDLTKLTGADESAHLAAAPVYVIEDLGIALAPAVVAATPALPAAATRIFRITARGVGGSSSIARVIESVYPVAQ